MSFEKLSSQLEQQQMEKEQLEQQLKKTQEQLENEKSEYSRELQKIELSKRDQVEYLQEKIECLQKQLVEQSFKMTEKRKLQDDFFEKLLERQPLNNEIMKNDIVIKMEERAPKRILKIDLSKFPTNPNTDEIEIIFEKSVSPVLFTRMNTKTNENKREEKPLCAFAKFFCGQEKITLEDIKHFQSKGVDIEEPDSCFSSKSGYSSALHFACEKRLYEKTKILLEVGINPGLLIGENSGCCDCISPVDAVICGDKSFEDMTKFDKIEKHLRLLVEHGAMHKISSETFKLWKETVERKDVKINDYIKMFMKRSLVWEMRKDD
jgi:hypothetical protein